MQEIETRSGWLTRDQLRDARERLPILYVNLVPVRVDERSQVTQIGLLLRASETGEIQRELVSGRVLYHERLRDAVLRHIERDLGPMALPQVPIAPQPFAVAEYFPTPGVTPFHDPRQHAVALAYVVVLMAHPCRGERVGDHARDGRRSRGAVAPGAGSPRPSDLIVDRP